MSSDLAVDAIRAKVQYEILEIHIARLLEVDAIGIARSDGILTAAIRRVPLERPDGVGFPTTGSRLNLRTVVGERTAPAGAGESLLKKILVLYAGLILPVFTFVVGSLADGERRKRCNGAQG